MQKRYKFRVAKTRLQNCSRTGCGSVLGSILERFCMAMDLLWTLLGTSDTIFWSVRHRACIRCWSKLASKRPSGSIWGSSWRYCQRNWKILGGFSAILDKISADGNVLLAPSYKSAASAARPIQYKCSSRTFVRLAKRASSCFFKSPHLFE